MDQETAKRLVQYITQHMWRESALMYPDPQVQMNDPYGLLDLIKVEAKLDNKTIDGWMVESQK